MKLFSINFTNQINNEEEEENAERYRSLLRQMFIIG